MSVSLEAGDPAPAGDSLDDPLTIETAFLTEEGMDEPFSDEPPPALIMEPDVAPTSAKKKRQIFAARVRQRMHGLQEQHFELEDLIEGRPTALRAVAARDGRF